MFNYTLQKESTFKYYPITPADDVANGERLFVSIGQLQIVIFRIADFFYAIGDVCSHDDGPLGDGEVIGEEVVCPRHGARFNIRTGAVTSPPAVLDIPAYPVRMVEGMIEIGVPIE